MKREAGHGRQLMSDIYKLCSFSLMHRFSTQDNNVEVHIKAMEIHQHSDMLYAGALKEVKVK